MSKESKLLADVRAIESSLAKKMEMSQTSNCNNQLNSTLIGEAMMDIQELIKCLGSQQEDWVRRILPLFFISSEDFDLYSVINNIKVSIPISAEIGSTSYGFADISKLNTLLSDGNIRIELFLDFIKRMAITTKIDDSVKAATEHFNTRKSIIFSNCALNGKCIDETGKEVPLNEFSQLIRKYSLSDLLSQTTFNLSQDDDPDVIFSLRWYESLMNCFEYYMHGIVCRDDFLNDNRNIDSFKKLLTNYLSLYLYRMRDIFALPVTRDSNAFGSVCELDGSYDSSILPDNAVIIFNDDRIIANILRRITIVINGYFERFIDKNNREAQTKKDFKDAARKERARLTDSRREARKKAKSAEANPNLAGQDITHTADLMRSSPAAVPATEFIVDKLCRILGGQRDTVIATFETANARADRLVPDDPFVVKFFELKNELGEYIESYDTEKDMNEKNGLLELIQITFDQMKDLVNSRITVHNKSGGYASKVKLLKRW